MSSTGPQNTITQQAYILHGPYLHYFQKPMEECQAVIFSKQTENLCKRGGHTRTQRFRTSELINDNPEITLNSPAFTLQYTVKMMQPSHISITRRSNVNLRKSACEDPNSLATIDILLSPFPSWRLIMAICRKSLKARYSTLALTRGRFGAYDLSHGYPLYDCY